MGPRKVLLLSAYDAMSHKYWRQGLTQYFADFQWTVLSLPPRFFAWRVRGNPLSWAEAPELHGEYDLIIATSMVDLCVLRGLFPSLARVPTIQYFHENQFAYPVAQKSRQLLEPQMVSIYSAMAANCLLFNSQYNLASFRAGLENLLSRFPDFVPPGLADKIAAKAKVLPVPIHQQLFALQPLAKKSGGVDVVWNHRWEYDKGVDRLLEVSKLLPAETHLRFHVVGQQFRRAPAEMSQLKAVLQQKKLLGRWGFIGNTAEYWDLLRSCDVVLSTAIHDFQGLSILEAAVLGCQPLVPDRLAYQEIFARDFRYSSDLENKEKEAESLVEKLKGFAAHCPSLPESLNMEQWSWSSMGPKYREVMDSLL